MQVGPIEANYEPKRVQPRTTLNFDLNREALVLLLNVISASVNETPSIFPPQLFISTRRDELS
jgi:hypothetical protein